MGGQRVWTDVMVVVSIVSVGIVVAGITDRPNMQSAIVSDAFAFEPADSDADIPGCDTVEPGGDGHSFVSMSVGEKPDSYDNPAYPWFGGPKASAMSEALRGALPGDAEVKFATSAQSLVFQPIVGPLDGDPTRTFESTSAQGTLVRGGAEGLLSVSVLQDDSPPPPCIAGALDERKTMSDGTVVDTSESWYEYAGQRSVTRSAAAYTSDGSRVQASTAGADALILSVEELADIALLPELRTTAPVPAGAVAPVMPCTAMGSDGSGPSLTRDDLTALNDSLNSFWNSASRPVTLDRPLGSLQLDRYSATSACADLTYGVGQTLTLSVTPAIGSFDFNPDQAYPGYAQNSTTLPDGSVLRTSGVYVLSPTGAPPQTVALDTVSGRTITIRASDRAVGLELLQSIALTAGAVFA